METDELERFCATAYPRLVGALGLYCGDRLLAEELAQEALLRVCRRWSTVRGYDSPLGWAYRVGVNLTTSHRRRAGAERRARARRGHEPPVHAPDPGDVLDLRAALAALPVRQRTVVVLRHYLDLTAEQTGAAMGIGPEAVRSLTYRAVGRCASGWLSTPRRPRMAELRELMERAAPEPSRPLDAAALVRRAHRQRRLASTTAGLAVLGIAAVAVTAALRLGEGPAIVLDGATPSATAPNATAPPGASEDRGVRFEVLGVATAFGADTGVVAATDQEELADVWVRYGFSGSAPSVDFDQHVVVVFARVDDACPDEVVGFDVDGERVTARWQRPPGGCNRPAIRTATATALDRAAVPSPFVAVLDVPHEERAETRVDPGPPPATPAPDEPLAAPPAPDTVLGEAPLPADGAALARLDDGTPVWVVRHEDATVSVLAADAPLEEPSHFGRVAGLRSQALWLPAERRFLGPTPYDERGRSFHGRAATNLEWHAVRVDGARVLIGERVGPVPGGGAIATLRTGGGDWQEPVHPDHPHETPAVPLDEALRAPDGSVVVADASLVAWADRPLQICTAPDPPELWGWGGCPEDAPVPAGLGPAEMQPNSMNVWFGPLRMRVEAGRIVEVVLLGAGTAGTDVDG